MAEPLFLMKGAAAEYLGGSKQELPAYETRGQLPADRRLPGDDRPQSGARLWLRSTLDAAKPLLPEWRERDRMASETSIAKFAAEQAADKARGKGMRKGGALLAGKVCEQLGCSGRELNRRAADGRLPPDGEIVLVGTFPQNVEARAWLPATIEAAKPLLGDWRIQDQTKKSFKRRGLKIA